MTLNLMLATQDTIHLAADLRLSLKDKVVSDSSAKVIRVEQQDWQALVTYCGVGRVYRDTSHQIRDWITSCSDEAKSFPGLVEILRREGTRWLKTLTYKDGHTFLVGGIVRGHSQIALVSNVDRLHGPRRARVLTELQAEFDSPISRVVVCGSGAVAVSRHSLQKLKAAARNGDDIRQIQRDMAAIIRAASASPKSKASVSSSSYTYSISPTGGVGTNHGAIVGGFEPLTIFHGQDLLSHIRKAIGPKAQVVPLASFRFEAGKAEVRDTCSPELSQLGSADARLGLTELEGVGGFARARCINDEGVSGGQCSPGDPKPNVACTWSRDFKLQIVQAATPPSQVNGINDQGEIVGTMQAEGGVNRAFRFGKMGFHVLGTLGGLHSHGFAINNSGMLIGSSHMVPGPGNARETAFICGSDLQLRAIGALHPEWNSRPTAINSHGTVVGHTWRPGGMFGGHNRAFVWSGQAGMTDIGTLGGPSAVPIAINDNGIVVGITSDASGRNCSFRWTEADGMSELCPELNSTGVVAINAAGDVVFTLSTDDGGYQGVVVTSGGVSKSLQNFIKHEVEPHAINNRGQVVGQVSRGRHSHAAIWM